MRSKITEEKFKRASEMKKDEIKKSIREVIKEKWEGIPWLRVKCPKCEKTQKVHTDRQVRCKFCMSSFKVYPSNKPSRIVEVPEGTLHILRQIRALRKYGKFDEIL